MYSAPRRPNTMATVVLSKSTTDGGATLHLSDSSYPRQDVASSAKARPRDPTRKHFLRTYDVVRPRVRLVGPDPINRSEPLKQPTGLRSLVISVLFVLAWPLRFAHGLWTASVDWLKTLPSPNFAAEIELWKQIRGWGALVLFLLAWMYVAHDTAEEHETTKAALFGISIALSLLLRQLINYFYQ